MATSAPTPPPKNDAELLASGGNCPFGYGQNNSNNSNNNSSSSGGGSSNNNDDSSSSGSSGVGDAAATTATLPTKRADAEAVTAATTANDNDLDAINPENMMPLNPKQQPAPDQRFPLPTYRTQSTIPKANASDSPRWMYPSQQMFFNALRRKGYEGVAEEEMETMIAIHNTVNERGWWEVLQWERRYADVCAAPKLASFKGLARDYSPKARAMMLWGYEAPFDRHDWIVDRCGTRVRYIIDYYGRAPPPGDHSPGAGIHLDVRPALDSFQAARDRIFKWAQGWRGE